ncbi:MAG: hypothetical protein RJA61_720 [Candidatus Parcubacteria bacterium]|jgi:hypothetical protein
MSPIVADKLSVINRVIINPLILLMFAVALLVFFIGIFQMIANSESDEAREKGKQTMIYGIFGFFIMIGVYGIIQLILSTFGLDSVGSSGYLGDILR